MKNLEYSTLLCVDLSRLLKRRSKWRYVWVKLCAGPDKDDSLDDLTKYLETCLDKTVSIEGHFQEK